MVTKDDIVAVASSINMEVQQNEIDWVLENFEGCQNEADPWHITIEDMLYQVRNQNQ